MNRNDLHQLVRIRLAEARILLRGGRYEGAYYLAGYAVECALKACIARQIRKFDFPDKKLVLDSHSHNLEQLLSVSGLKQLHQNETQSDPQFAVNWAVVRDWSEQDRYVVGISRAEARDLYAAVTARTHGILTWLKKHW
ncbi:MAG TPA: HEPN domain-containing protein [Thermoanaerobaculia bacterium]|nr:HEPN domain-containing protein [Thermoanaerobaculia bacterium]